MENLQEILVGIQVTYDLVVVFCLSNTLIRGGDVGSFSPFIIPAYIYVLLLVSIIYLLNGIGMLAGFLNSDKLILVTVIIFDGYYDIV